MDAVARAGIIPRLGCACRLRHSVPLHAACWLALAITTASASSYMQLNGIDVTNAPILNSVSVGAAVPGVDYPGNDLQTFPYISSSAACASLCQQTIGCVGYGWHDAANPWKPNQCYVKSLMQASNASLCPTCHCGSVSSDPIAYVFDTPHMKALCESTNGCVAFSTGDGFLRAFASNSSVISYLSNATCGYGVPASIQGGSPFAPQGEFVVCTVQGGFPYVTTAAFNLPPFLLQEACDQSKTCVGFMALADGSQGWLLSWSPATTASDVALFASSLPSP
jgi:PAN domain